MPTIPISAESYRFSRSDFRITISNDKITENNDFKMVPDKIMGVTLTEANGRLENIMHEDEVKLSAMQLGGKKRVLY